MKDAELLVLERKVRGCWNSILSNNSFWISSPKEAEYLLQGHATELIEKIWVPCCYDENAQAEVYGIVAADRTNGRYVWAYLYYRNHIWRCHSIKWALDIIDKIREHNKLEEKKNRLRKKVESKVKLLSVCSN